jgi:hypothetical protein
LVKGNSALSIPTERDESILDAFVVLDGYSDQMIAQIKSLLDPVPGLPRGLSDVGVVDELLGLAELSMEYLARMNAITGDYQTISDDRISNLLLVELIVLCFTAAILVIEIIFVVIPSIRHALKTRQAIPSSSKNGTASKMNVLRNAVQEEA